MRHSSFIIFAQTLINKISDFGNHIPSEFTSVSTSRSSEKHDSRDKLAEAKSLIAKLTEEKNSAILQNRKLRQQLETLKRKGDKQREGIALLFLVLTGMVIHTLRGDDFSSWIDFLWPDESN